MKKIRLAKPAWAALLAALLLAAGCFDYEVELTLNETGNGVMEVRLDLPAHLARNSQIDLGTIVYPVPQRIRDVQEGRLTVSERLEFEWLDVMAMRRLRFQVEEIGTGILGMTAYTYRMTVWLESMEGDLPDRSVKPGLELEERAPAAAPSDPAAAKAARLLAGGLAGHYVSLTMNLPGEIIKAWPLVAGSAKAEPEVTGGWVRWRVPLSDLAASGVRNTLVFRCDFKGDLDFRGPTQSTASTRFPSEEDVKAAEKAMLERGGAKP